MPLQGASIRGLWDAREVHTPIRASHEGIKGVGHGCCGEGKEKRPGDSWTLSSLARAPHERAHNTTDPIGSCPLRMHTPTARNMQTITCHPAYRGLQPQPHVSVLGFTALSNACVPSTPAASTSLHRMWHSVDLRRVKWHLSCVETLISVPSKPMLRSRRWKENSFNAGLFFFSKKKKYACRACKRYLRPRVLQSSDWLDNGPDATTPLYHPAISSLRPRQVAMQLRRPRLTRKNTCKIEPNISKSNVLPQCADIPFPPRLLPLHDGLKEDTSLDCHLQMGIAAAG